MTNLPIKHQNWRTMLSIVVLILLTASFYLTSCKPTTITITPSPTQLAQERPEGQESTSAPTHAPKSSYPSLSISQSGNTVGSLIGVGGAGFIPNQTVIIRFGDIEVSRVAADTDGLLGVTFYVPPTEPGLYTITVSDGTNMAETPFTVTVSPSIVTVPETTPTLTPTPTTTPDQPLLRRPSGYPAQMKRYITPDDPVVQALLHDILHSELKIFSDFEALRDWAAWHISYKYDQSIHGVNEYWQLPSETLELGTGDCEDFAILLCSLLRAYGVPSNQVYVACGYGEGKTSGHAYLVEKWYKGVWRVIEPQAGVWTGMFINDWLTSTTYEEVLCFNDQDYFEGAPTLPSGVYEFEVGNSFYPMTRGATVSFKRHLSAGENVTSSFEWLEGYSMIFGWSFTIYAPDGSIALTENGTNLKHGFSFTPIISGTYTVELLKRDALPRCARLTIDPPDWN